MSGVDYRQWDSDDRVSDEWFAVLSAARRDGVAFSVTDGHRTLAEQRDRFAVFQRFGRPVAARPIPRPPTSARVAPIMRSTSTRSTAAPAASPHGCDARAPERPSPSRASRGTSSARDPTSSGSPAG